MKHAKWKFEKKKVGFEKERLRREKRVSLRLLAERRDITFWCFWQVWSFWIRIRMAERKRKEFGFGYKYFEEVVVH
jgi:hypothetical protein